MPAHQRGVGPRCQTSQHVSTRVREARYLEHPHRGHERAFDQRPNDAMVYSGDQEKGFRRTITLDGLPDDVRAGLLAFDIDGDGEISRDELIRAAEVYRDSVRSVSRMTKIIVGLTAALAVVVGCTGGLTYGIIEATKETKVAGTMLTTPYGDAISVNTNTVTIPMATLAFAPAEFSASLDSISFGSQDESTLYHRRVDSVDVVADTSVVVKTTTGDVLSYTGGSTITIQLAGSATTWTKQASCTRCSSLNVHLTSELDAAIDKAIDAFGTPNSRKLLGFSCW